MKITKLGHSCLLVEESGARILVDPGAFSAFEGLTGLSGVLVTHQHFDHVDVEKLRALLAANPDATLVVDPGTAEQLSAAGIPGARTLGDGDTLDVAGVEVCGFGRDHAPFHADAPNIVNTGYLIAGRLFHPGDALAVPGFEVEVLAVPIVAPWSNIGQTVDFVRAVKPKVAFPIHDAIIVPPAYGIFDNTVQGLGPEGTTFRRIDDEPLEV
ncbi:MBL fold metallo-hydrolase [Motilibacter aurantiacus]|uniref:MBL fold metallo-hydrolase n=1 Tax=Motilibacter aurantiacus TaxID=2714955 RepID=UPI001408B280|nr:MBL fold metallo-hydrolase [Motilibacter aurantiacus]